VNVGDQYAGTSLGGWAVKRWSGSIVFWFGRRSWSGSARRLFLTFICMLMWLIDGIGC